MRGPHAAVVIPTHNRAADVLSALAALERQDCGTDVFEVVVVPNGCTDETVATLRTLHPGFSLSVHPIDEASASEARNAGAKQATAPLLIFMDDDIVPDPWFVSGHLEAHARGDAACAAGEFTVAIGYLPAVLQPEGDRFAITLRGWWESMFDRMRSPGHRFDYTDLLSGNFSIARSRFVEAGGFDSRFRCHEDYEFGYRLVAAGARLVFAPRASGWHLDRTRLERACWRKREEGIADVQLAGLHPDLTPRLLLARNRSVNQRIIRSLAFRAPAAGDAMAACLRGLLRAFDRIGATSAWRRVMNGLLGYWYERGLADVLDNPAAVAALVSARHGRPAAGALDLDLACGVDAALQRVDELRPDAVSLRFGRQVIGELTAIAGAERLTARHVQAALIMPFNEPYLRALIDARHPDYHHASVEPRP
jgi:GT2 family glycosyltransferase